MKITINAEITKQAQMHDGSEPFMIYETNLISGDGSPVFLTNKSIGKLWNPVEEPEEEESHDTAEESIHIRSDECEVVSGSGEEA